MIVEAGDAGLHDLDGALQFFLFCDFLTDSCVIVFYAGKFALEIIKSLYLFCALLLQACDFFLDGCHFFLDLIINGSYFTLQLLHFLFDIIFALECTEDSLSLLYLLFELNSV